MEDASSKSPPPLTLLDGEVARLLLELIETADWCSTQLTCSLQTRVAMRDFFEHMRIKLSIEKTHAYRFFDHHDPSMEVLT